MCASFVFEIEISERWGVTISLGIRVSDTFCVNEEDEAWTRGVNRLRREATFLKRFLAAKNSSSLSTLSMSSSRVSIRSAFTSASVLLPSIFSSLTSSLLQSFEVSLIKGLINSFMREEANKTQMRDACLSRHVSLLDYRLLSESWEWHSSSHTWLMDFSTEPSFLSTLIFADTFITLTLTVVSSLSNVCCWELMRRLVGQHPSSLSQLISDNAR